MSVRACARAPCTTREKPRSRACAQELLPTLRMAAYLNIVSNAGADVEHACLPGCFAQAGQEFLRQEERPGDVDCEGLLKVVARHVLNPVRDAHACVVDEEVQRRIRREGRCDCLMACLAGRIGRYRLQDRCHRQGVAGQESKQPPRRAGKAGCAFSCQHPGRVR